MSTGQAIQERTAGESAFETRDFYLACFLRCAGYELIDLRAEGRRKVSSSAIAPRGATTCWRSTATPQRSRRWPSPPPSRT